LVGNAVRSPHTRQAYVYALEQFFQWAAGRAISRGSVQGYVTWLGEMKFSPSTINERLAAIRKLANRSAALLLRGQRDGAEHCHGCRRECQGQTAGAYSRDLVKPIEHFNSKCFHLLLRFVRKLQIEPVLIAVRIS
jgi:hypothetical protein